MELICLIAYFELNLMSLALHIFHQNKKDHSDTANLPTAGPDWINLRLWKGCLESRIMLRLGEALIVGVLWRTAGAPAKQDLMFCQLSAPSESVTGEEPRARFLPATAVEIGCHPSLHPRGTGHDWDLPGMPVRAGSHNPASTAVLTVGTAGQEGAGNLKLATKCWSSPVLLK